MSLPTYSARNVSVSWGGATLEGLAPDSFITFSRNADILENEPSADGQSGLSVLPDGSGTCTLSFTATSPSNRVLAGVLQEQRQLGVIVAAGIIIRDFSGSAIAKLRFCSIQAAPEVILGSTATGNPKEWVFFVEEIEYTKSPTGVNTALDAKVNADIATIIAV